MFWYGDLSKYEEASIHSYLKNGFEVIVWSLEELNIPSGAKRGNASEILPKSYLDRASQAPHGGKSDSSSILHGAVALYSDLFRYLVLRKHGGWWFDLDTICLRPAEEFEALAKGRKICLSYENMEKTSINGAVLSVPDKKICELLVNRALSIFAGSGSLSWGELGPRLLTEICQTRSADLDVLDINIFYPNSTNPEISDMMRSSIDISESAIKTLKNNLADAYTFHWYNSTFTKEDKLELPDEKSLFGSILRKNLN